jgi:hypothetical protein
MNSVKTALIVGCLVVAPLLLPQPALADTNPRLGTWTLNVAKSKYEPGQAPKSETRTYTASGTDGVTMEAETVQADGTRQSSGYTAKYDGKRYAYKGPAGDQISMTSAKGFTVRATVWKAGRAALTTHSVVSRDGRTMTMSSTSTTATGKVVSTRVYDKQ